MAGITIDFNANLANVDNGLRNLNRRLGEFSNDWDGVRDAAGSALRIIGAGSVAAVAGFGVLVHEVLDAGDAMQKLSQRTGVAVEDLTGLKLAADLSDTNIDAAGQALNRLGRSIATNRAEMEQLGITAKDPLKALEQFADIFVAIEDPMQRAAVAQKVLGKSWEEIAPLLAGGGKALADIVKQGSAASGITTDLANTSAELNDKISILTNNYRGMILKGVAPAIPILNELYDLFVESEHKTDGVEKSTGALTEIYKLAAESIAVFAFGVDIAGKGVGALAAKLNAVLHLDFAGFDAIDKAFKEGVAAADARLTEFFKKVEGVAPKVDVGIETHDAGASANKAIDGKINDYLDAAGKGSDKVSDEFKKMDSELNRHLKLIETDIDQEVNLYQFRNKQLEIAFDVGLVEQEDYFAQKQRLQQDQYNETQALLDQEINALRQFQNQATEDAARTDAQDKINELLREKLKLEQDNQIAQLENAAAARQALGDQAASLYDLNDLLQGVTSSVIGLSEAQAKLNFKDPSQTATAEDLGNGTIFRSADGTSFSDRPTTVGVTLDLPQDTLNDVDQKINEFRQQAIADSAILLGIDFDQAAALAKFDDTTQLVNDKAANALRPLDLAVNVNPDDLTASVNRARDAAQAQVAPIVIPVVYQTQTAPQAADAQPPQQAIPSLDETALANGSR